MRNHIPQNRILSLSLVVLIAAPLTSLLAGCAHKQLDPSSLKSIERPAIVLRPLSDPELSLSQADADQTNRLRGRLNAFQISERLRSAIIAHLPSVEPWTSIMPSVEVATVLDLLLVQDKAEKPRYELLQEKGSNTVLEVTVRRCGLRFNAETNKTGFFLEGEARLFHIGGSTLWKAPLNLDSTLLPEFPGLVPAELSHDGYFDALNDFLFRLTDPMGLELAAGLPVQR
jgi:hypothetical protein